MAVESEARADREPLSPIERLVVQVARENRQWGYRWIQGALANPGHTAAPSTIADILRRNGIEPAPERSRKTSWKEFLAQHWDLIVAADFFTVDVWTGKGLRRFSRTPECNQSDCRRAART